jgi:hypothetical protein
MRLISHQKKRKMRIQVMMMEITASFNQKKILKLKNKKD